MHFFFPPFFHSLDSCPIPFPPPFLGRGGVRFPDFATFLCYLQFSSFFQPTCQFPSGAPKHSFKVVPPPFRTGARASTTLTQFTLRLLSITTSALVVVFRCTSWIWLCVANSLWSLCGGRGGGGEGGGEEGG